MSLRFWRGLVIGAGFGLIFGLLGGFLSGCSDPGAEVEAGDISIEDAWAKATDTEMSAVFGVLSSSSDADITIKSVSTEVAEHVEMHQTGADANGQMAMSEVEGGLVIPAGGSLTLEPGGYHFMLMKLKDALVAGDAVSVTMTFSDGSTLSFDAVVKDFAGANEEYHED